jgi:hypothetical protein
MIPIEEGMQIDTSDEHHKNVNSPRTEILQPDSNVKDDRFPQLVKQLPETVSTDEGMQIDSNEQPRNADSPRIEIAEPSSNLRSESCPQPQKQDLEIVSTDNEIQIDRSREHP